MLSLLFKFTFVTITKKIGEIMENAFLIIITLAAGFYLYRKIFKSGGCGCSDGGSCKTKK